MAQRNKFEIQFWQLVLGCTILAMFGCKDETTTSSGENSQPASEQTSPPVFQPIFQPKGNGKIVVELVGLQSEKPAKLCRVQGNHLVDVLELKGSESETIELESGFYTVVQSNSELSRYPVPALSGIVEEQPLKITLEPFPANESGWCWIPGGPTVMGDTLGVGREDERPARLVSVPGFWMAEHEITNREYAGFLSAIAKSGKTIPEDWIDLRSRKCRIQKSKASTNDRKFESDADELPVVMVSLKGALQYCDWLSQKTGQTYRLPSELEWEKAARGPELFVYSYGNIYKQSLANQESGKLKPVGSYAPNSYGLYDMTGNVFEWMSDVADPSKSETVLNHSLRGGSFILDGMYLRNSFRMRQSPEVMTDDIGFRVVREKVQN